MQKIRDKFIKILKDNSQTILEKYSNITLRASKMLKEDLAVKEEDVVGFCGGWSWFVKDNPSCNQRDSFGLVVAQNPFTMSIVNPELNSSDKLMLEVAKKITDNSFNFINIYPFRYYKLKNNILDLVTDFPPLKYRWESSKELVQDILNYLNPKLIILIGKYAQEIYNGIKPSKYNYVKEIMIRHPARNHRQFKEDFKKIMGNKATL